MGSAMSDQLPRHVLTILAVSDLQAAADFYSRSFRWPISVETPVYVEFSLPDNMRLGLYQRHGFAKNTGVVPNEVPVGSTSSTELYFYVDDVVAVLQTVTAAGARVLSLPLIRPWGDFAAYVTDPDGNVVVLASTSL